ncbi:uncharacterized protein PV07_09276 [Cladophialophora immunda]|uniref:Major facilitator superfamily (MFS) profile domain-containing protein n=1 Tax=Cladophialophora immunda TaxID=569365 RepID=A0A0D2CRB9_9EURO|nr:uncharacterized protein PV07_09276 [Cladophialophora immunda]KIW26159.1 hypothetical protein PV07_09276 [Cladophialophora immunda]
MSEQNKEIQVDQSDDASVTDPSEQTNSGTPGKSRAERLLVRKMDFFILPMLATSFLVAYLDRNNLGNARIMTLQKDLRMTDGQFYNCLMLFFVGYCVFMLPANLLLRVIGPHRQLGGASILLGVCVFVMSAARNWKTIAGVRVLIGASEAFIQSLVLYTNVWYKRDEVATRGAVYYSAATISGSFSGLLAYGVEKNLTGVHGKAGWQWLFIIEGAIAVGLGLLVWIILPGFPDQMKNKKKFPFTDKEVALAIDRSLVYNTPESKVQPRQILIAFKDARLYLFSLITGSLGLGVASLSSFLPSFIRAFGFSPLNTQLFSVIPYACATATMIVVNILSDRTGLKGYFLMGTLGLSCVGYIILLTVTNVPVLIFGTCLVSSGVFPSVVLLVAWVGINIAGYTKRATVYAISQVFSQCLSMIGTQIYKKSPRYIEGHCIVLALLVTGLILTVTAQAIMRIKNRGKERVKAEYASRNEIHPHMEKSLEEVYDDHIAFRYIL